MPHRTGLAKNLSGFLYMGLTQFLLICLSVWRIAHFFADTSEDGPFDLAHRVRSLVGVEFDELSRPYGTNIFSNLILCVWCSSFWYGIVAAIIYALMSNDVANAIWLPLATSGFSVLAEEYIS